MNISGILHEILTKRQTNTVLPKSRSAFYLIFPMSAPDASAILGQSCLKFEMTQQSHP